MEDHKVPGQDADAKARQVLRSLGANRPKVNVDAIVKRAIEHTKGSTYTSPIEKPGKIKGLKKEVDHDF